MIKFVKTRDVKSPQRKYGDAGIDFFVPNYSPEFAIDLMSANEGKAFLIKPVRQQVENEEKFTLIHQILLPAHSDIKIPAGIHSLIDPDTVLFLTNKSGVATKKRLDVGATTIDYAYEGEIHLHLTNTSDDTIIINFGEKIVQGLVLKHNEEELSVNDDIITKPDGVDKEQELKRFYEGHESHRGTKGFGEGTKNN